MRRAPLLLSARGSSSVTSVPAYITERLRKHHIEAVRSIYSSYIKGRNVLISTEDGMNDPLVVCAFLAAVNAFPVCIVCQDSHVSPWQYELESTGRFKVNVFNESVTRPEDVQDVMLVTQRCLKSMHGLRVGQWRVVVLDILRETKLRSLYLRRIKSDFFIGVVRVECFPDFDKNICGNVLKWARLDANASEEKLWSYPEHWLRLTWCNFQNEKPTPAEKIVRRRELREWKRSKREAAAPLSEEQYGLSGSSSSSGEEKVVQVERRQRRRRKRKRCKSKRQRRGVSVETGGSSVVKASADDETRNSVVRDSNREGGKLETHALNDFLDSLFCGSGSDGGDGPECVTTRSPVADRNPILDSLIASSSDSSQRAANAILDDLFDD